MGLCQIVTYVSPDRRKSVAFWKHCAAGGSAGLKGKLRFTINNHQYPNFTHNFPSPKELVFLVCCKKLHFVVFRNCTHLVTQQLNNYIMMFHSLLFMVLCKFQFKMLCLLYFNKKIHKKEWISWLQWWRNKRQTQNGKHSTKKGRVCSLELSIS